MVFILACGQADNEPQVVKDPNAVAADTIPEMRKLVNPDAVDSYTEKVPDELNNWHFFVSLSETKKTFQYLVRIQYKELRVTDSIVVPDFGIMPKVAIRKGKEPLSCILGFYDRKEQFREYKLVSIKNDQLKINTLNNYGVTRYRLSKP